VKARAANKALATPTTMAAVLPEKPTAWFTASLPAFGADQFQAALGHLRAQFRQAVLAHGLLGFRQQHGFLVGHVVHHVAHQLEHQFVVARRGRIGTAQFGDHAAHLVMCSGSLFSMTFWSWAFGRITG
jgi:hypothetical protein